MRALLAAGLALAALAAAAAEIAPEARRSGYDFASPEIRAMQDDETRALVERRGWTLVDSYEDVGVSGTRERRPELDRLLADARRHRFDLVVVLT